MGQNWSDVVRFENITLAGVLHYRVEFSVLVKTLVAEEKPNCICVELPHALRNEIMSGARRLPYHSVILYETASNESAVLILEGSDGTQEAVRSALEQDVDLWFVDPLPVRFPLFLDRIPDAYLIDRIGQGTFLDLLAKSGNRLSTDPDNTRRETFMAARLQEAARKYEKVLFVGGLAHIPGVLEHLPRPQALLC